MAQLKISAWAIRNPITVTVVFVALTIAGIFSYFILPVKQFPDISFPAVTVTITQNGASPAELETQITRPVEDAVAGISGINDIRSSVTLGSSVTTISFEIGEDEQRAKDEVQSAVDRIRATLPREIDEPVISRVEFDSLPILTYAVAAPMDDAALSWFIDDTISRKLLGLPGVSQINRVGGADREINIVVDLDRLNGFGVTVPQLNDALRQFSVNAPGGRLAVGGREQTIRILGQADTVQQLSRLTIPLAGGRYVRLSDVASIGAGAGEARNFARLDGRPVVGFQVLKTKEASDVGVEDEVTKAIAELEREHRGVGFTKVLSTVDETRASFESTVHVLIEGMVLAALVVFLFLRDWRSTMIAAVAMPLSLIPTFAAMLMFGFTLNIVTLLGLTLVIGILVDDAIVEIENIEKRIERGQQPYDAAMEGADAIGLAVVATTAAIVVVFTPVSAMPGIGGQFFREFGVTVAVAVLFSLAVARYVTPLMAAYLLKPRAKDAGHTEATMPGWYRRLLDWALDHRWLAMIIGTLLFIGSLSLFAFVQIGFQPAQNPDYVNLQIKGPPGATRADMDAAVAETTRVFKARPEVGNVFANIGGGGGGGGGVAVSGGDLRNGSLIVVLKRERELTAPEFKTAMRPLLRGIAGASVYFLGDNNAPELTVTLTSQDGAALDRAAANVRREMGRMREVREPRLATLPASPEIQVVPRPAEMARLGVDSQTLASAARLATIGDIDANVAKLTEGERRIPLRVRIPETDRTDVESLGRLRLPTANGGTTTLDAVADIRFEAGPAQIDRYDRKRQAGLDADLAGGVALGTALQAVNALPAIKGLPAGVEQVQVGDAEALTELFQALAVTILASIMLLYFVMVLLFGSFFKPVTILSALPLAIGGAVLALLVTGLDLSLPSMIGFLMLLGIAAKNSILLVEYAIEREREGYSQRDAIMEACRERARPIVMTTFAMGAGMLPTALAIGEGAEFRQPMAVAVIGGLITSTALSLVFVPVIYEFIDDLEMRLRPKLARFITQRETHDAPKEAHA